MRDDWSGDDPVELVDHIMRNYHQPLDGDLRRLRELTAEAESAGVDVRLGEVRRIFVALEAELRDHMDKEEQVLFPMIQRGETDMADGPIEIMSEEHIEALGALTRLRELCDGYAMAPGQDGRVAALYRSMERFEAMMCEHIRLEDELLFPMCLD